MAQWINKGSEDGDRFENWLDEIECDLSDRDRTSDFIESVRGQWDELGRVSQKQMDAVENFYNRI